MAATLAVNHDGQQTFPSSASSSWTTLAAPELTTADNGGNSITDPSAEYSETRLFKRERNRGTILRARVIYTGSPGTDAVIEVFGRYDNDDYWQPIRNKAGDIEVTMTSASGTDVVNGSDKYTTPDLNAHSWDCDGFNEFFVVVKTATDATTASLQVRFI